MLLPLQLALIAGHLQATSSVPESGALDAVFRRPEANPDRIFWQTLWVGFLSPERTGFFVCWECLPQANQMSWKMLCF